MQTNVKERFKNFARGLWVLKDSDSHTGVRFEPLNGCACERVISIRMQEKSTLTIAAQLLDNYLVIIKII